jgi:hypothetical protein
MKKSSQDTMLFNEDLAANKNPITDKTKTTNVNILLNRVRLDKKRDLRKKLFFLFILVIVISAITIYALI